MNQAETVLVVGADGMIGRALAERLAVRGRHVLCTTLVPTPGAVVLDLARDAAEWTPPPAATAYLCAAVTSQDQCRAEPAKSRAVNVEGTLALAEKLVRQGTHVVFPSTNLVLDGRTPHQPADAPYAPQTEYGRQKAEAEQRLRRLPGTCVVRFTKVLGRATPLLLGWIAALREGQPIRPFSDMPLAPVPLDFAVEALVTIAARRAEGIVQVSAEKDITYAEAARFVADCLHVPLSASGSNVPLNCWFSCQTSSKQGFLGWKTGPFWLSDYTADHGNQQLSGTLSGRGAGGEGGLVQPVTVADSGISIEYVPNHTTLDTTRLQHEFGLVPPLVWAAITLAMQP